MIGRRGTTSQRARSVLGTTALAVVMVAAGCSNDPKSAAKAATTTTSSTTTTVAETTSTVPAVPVATAPLTGLGVDAAGAARLARPALAIKIDNSTDALPQSGINSTDVVLEIQVEGISRLMAVFQSNDSNEVGPTRSARYSDPDLLALFGNPLFGWSGANDGVVKAVHNAKWIVNVNWDSVNKSDYVRKSGRPAPHNLFTKTSSLFGYARPGEAAPAPIFDFLAAGQSNPVATPAAGIVESVGDTPSQWVWDAPSGQWLRWEYGRAHGTDAGQVTATNVVVLDTVYTKGPVAKSVGSGVARVFTGGTVAVGRWTRAARTDRYTLSTLDGQPLKVAPGRTWIELPNTASTAVMDPNTASGLLATRQ